MKAFYLALLQHFEDHKQDFIDAQLKPIKTIDFYAGQDQDPENFNNLFFPALFFSWNINYDNNPEKPTAVLEFRLVYENLRDTSNLSLNKEKALAFFDTACLVDALLKELNIKEMGALHLVSEGLEVEPTVTDVYLLNYEALYYANEKTRIRELQEGNINDVILNSHLKAKTNKVNRFQDLL
ncbi:hypothetical protein [Psychroflexus sp. ALD_RP9]|uniref:hypothetical protein n=1 Tax=Psychroflexus sp. ALD_RP9 TaxID=2777186 RepID=UPI001A8F32D8|nr:hypothetical protein [Psychroflexus sp. ALD_RP9]QSS96599.1 hypothetical protein IMZ30_09110 [Psychroflexus sp. ALD_RP9]